MFTQLLNTDHLQPPPLDQMANQFSRLVTTNINSSITSLLDRMVLCYQWIYHISVIHFELNSCST